MKAVIETSTGLALYLLPDGETVSVTESGMVSDTVSATDIRPDTHSVVENVPQPVFWFGGALVWDGSAWSYASGNVGLDARKARMKADVDALEAEKTYAGFGYDFGVPYGVKTLQTREQDRPNWLAVAQVASLQIAQGGGDLPLRTIRTADNTNVPVTANQALAAMLGMQAHLGAILERSWTLKDAIDAAADHDALDAIDINAGWPG